MAESLEKSGIHFDDLNRVKIIKPQEQQTCNELKSESSDFVSNLNEFDTVLEAITELTETMSKQVEMEKLKAIASRNALRNAETHKEAETDQLRALLKEKQTQLERLKREYSCLCNEESEQKEGAQLFLAA